MKQLIQPIKILILAIVLSIGVSYVYAWTGPASAPPEGNTPVPINVGATTQVKIGGLGVTNLIADSVTVGATANTSAITAPKFCIGTSCITVWPSGSGGTLTGNGSTNYISKWTSASSLDNSTIYDNGNVGIGTANPSYKLDVQGGDINASGVYRKGGAAGLTGTFTIQPSSYCSTSPATVVTYLTFSGGILTGITSGCQSSGD